MTLPRFGTIEKVVVVSAGKINSAVELTRRAASGETAEARLDAMSCSGVMGAMVTAAVASVLGVAVEDELDELEIQAMETQPDGQPAVVTAQPAAAVALTGLISADTIVERAVPELCLPHVEADQLMLPVILHWAGDEVTVSCEDTDVAIAL
jgi:hypothetical protein